MNLQGAIAGMIAGLFFTLAYVVFFKIAFPEYNTPEYWWFGISPEGIGTLGMLLNLTVSFAVGMIFPEPPEDVQNMVEEIRYPQ
jgi:cation/acetate symporter